VEGPGTCPIGPDRVQTSEKSRWRSAAKLPLMCWVRLRHRTSPPLRPPSPAAIGAALAGCTPRRALATTPRKHLACPTPKTLREADRLPRSPPTPRPTPATARAPATATTNSAQPATLSDWNKQFDLSLDPRKRRPANTTTKPCRRHLQRSRILAPMCGPKHCPMQTKISRMRFWPDWKTLLKPQEQSQSSCVA